MKQRTVERAVSLGAVLAAAISLSAPAIATTGPVDEPTPVPAPTYLAPCDNALLVVLCDTDIIADQT